MCCENFMVLQVKITLAVNKIQGDLVMLREMEALVHLGLTTRALKNTLVLE